MTNPNSDCKQQHILITGGTGFVGPHLIRYLKSCGSSITVLASGSSSEPDSDVEYRHVDIRDRDQVRFLVHQILPTSIYHLAGISAVDFSWSNPRITYEVNVLGTYNIIEAAMSLPVRPKILNVSTSQVYAPSTGALDERSLVAPDNPYAASKAMAELLAVQYRNADGGGIVIARSFNHSGPGQTPNFFLSSMAKQFAEIESELRPPKLAVGNLDVKRDFTDVRDVVRAYFLLLESGTPGEVYNVCSGVTVCLTDIVQIFQSKIGIDVIVETELQKSRPNDVAQIYGDSRKLREQTGWSPVIALEQTIQDVLDYWRSKCRETTTVIQ